VITHQATTETREIADYCDVSYLNDRELQESYLNDATYDQLVRIYAASLVDLDEARYRSDRLEIEIQRRTQHGDDA